MESMIVKPDQEDKKTSTEMTFLEELQDLFAFLHSLWGIRDDIFPFVSRLF